MIVPVLFIIGAAAVLITILSVWFKIQRFCSLKKPNQTLPETLPHDTCSFHCQQINIHCTNKKKANYYVFRRGISSKSLFSWSDNPSLVTGAVEDGWSRFAFTNYASSPSIQSTRSMLRSCTVSDAVDDPLEVEISWEVCQGSADFMQKIRFRFNSGMKEMISNNIPSMDAASLIKSALPLPGPPLGNSSSFPQEAYFEITILAGDNDSCDMVDKVKEAGKIEGENIKLMQESPDEKIKSESLFHVTNVNGNFVEEMGHGIVKHAHVGEVIRLSMGLTRGGSLPLKLPGSYPGSIGFNCNGSVFLDGTKLVFESEQEEWGREGQVIGCGFNPGQKRVFFTLDSQLVHEIHCKTEEFGTPLYPTLAANSDIGVLVNFGQSEFKYEPANLHRTPNPCFIANGSALGYEDSKELFSMGAIDSQWLNGSATRSHAMQQDPRNSKTGADFDNISEEVELFEIVWDGNSTGRSPQIPLHTTSI